MSATKIEYVDASWNPITGCDSEFPCWSYCWARRMARRLRGRLGYDAADPFRPTFHPDRLDQPTKLNRPRRIAVCFMGDLWAGGVDPAARDAVIRGTNAARQHTYLFLTKRIKYAAQTINWNEFPHLWVGTSVEDQATADERIPRLCRCRAAHRWLLIEPMSGPIRFRDSWYYDSDYPPSLCLDWVVLGGGPFPVHPDWVRSVRDQCQEAGTPFFFKQWGDWAPGLESTGPLVCSGNESVGRVIGMDGRRGCLANPPYAAVARIGKKRAGRVLDGREWSELPSV